MREHEPDFHVRLKEQYTDDDNRLLRSCASLQAMENITHEVNNIVYNMRLDSSTLEEVREIFRKAIAIYGNDDALMLIDLLKRHGDNLKGIAIILSDMVEGSEVSNGDMMEREKAKYKEYCGHHQLMLEECYAELRRVLLSRQKDEE